MPLTVASVGYPLAKVSRSTAGGAEQVLLMLDKALVERGERSLVIAPLGSRCHGLLVPVRMPAAPLDEEAKRKARRSFKQALEGSLARYPVDVVHMHGVDFHEYLPARDVPVVVSLHLPLAWYPEEALKMERPNLTLVSVSQAQARSAPSGSRIGRIISNGVDLGEYQAGRRKGDYALFLGRICPEKGVHLALDAAERANVRLIIAGKVFPYPEHEKYFRDMIRPRLGEKVQLIGPVGGAQKARLLAGAKCLLVPSLCAETSSLAAIEALAARTPVIAWPSGVLPEIVAHGRTGFLAASVQEMAEAIARAASISGDFCRREAERRFSSRAMISGYLNIYWELTAARKPGLRAA
jgi:glycosyltransferase involved in cell wall biosynthesis